MIQLLEKEDYINLGANDLVKKAVEVIIKREEENKKLGSDKK